MSTERIADAWARIARAHRVDPSPANAERIASLVECAAAVRDEALAMRDALRVDLDQRDAALAVLTRELADVRALAWSWRRLGAVLCGYDLHGEGCDRPATRTRSVRLSDTEAMVWWRCDAHEAGGEGWRDVLHVEAIRALTT